MTSIAPALLLQTKIWDMVRTTEPIPLTVLILLLLLSLLSWTIIFSKWQLFRQARELNRQFLRMFRKSQDLSQVAVASEQMQAAPLVAVFGFGYAEVERQIRSRGRLTNPVSLERSLQLGISEEVAKLERNMNWLATTATVSPFIGLFGTVWGIIDAFQAIGLAGATSMRAVAPGIAHALVATAAGLAAAIPAAVSYNHFGNVMREMGARMEDFSLEFLNVAERGLED